MINTIQMRKRRFMQGITRGISFTTGCALLCLSPLLAAKSLVDREDLKVNLNGEAVLGIFSSGEDYKENSQGDAQWQEGYLKLGLDFTAIQSQQSALYGGIAALASGTWGDGDALGGTTGDERRVAIEDAYLGWKSGTLLPALGENGLDISFGRQNFAIGDGFLVQGDSLNLGEGFGENLDRGGAYWLAARKSFGNTFIARLGDSSPWRGDIFWLESNNKAQSLTEVAGFNLEYHQENMGHLGITWIRGLSVDEQVFGGAHNHRDGLNTFSIRGQGSAGIPNVNLSFEYVKQSNSGEGVKDVDASAWYTEGTYTFSNVQWSPSLTYRYSRFSGDDANTKENEAFDPLFFGFSRGFGTWYQGEVAANYAAPFSSNNDVHHVALKIQPTETLGFGLLYFNFNTLETTDSVKDYASEWNLYAEWVVNDNLFISPLVGFYRPDEGAKPVQGNDKTNTYMQIFALYTF